MVDNRNEEAVSPVIGIILMVAVTVILAAIIGSYIFGAPQNATKTKVVGATAQLDTTELISVTYQGGPDSVYVTSLSITAPDGAITNYATPTVGSVYKLTQLPPPNDVWPKGKKHVVVVASFSDAPDQVILDTLL